MKKPVPNTPPSEEYKRALYDVYKTIHARRGILEHNSLILMTPLFGYREWSWRVIGISEGALSFLKDNGFKTEKSLQRDHFICNRKATFLEMLSAGKPLDFDAWWNLFWQNDPTVIMTKLEHNSPNKEKTLCLPLNWEEGYFTCNPLIGFKFRKTIEGAMLRERMEGNYKHNMLPLEKIRRNILSPPT